MTSPEVTAFMKSLGFHLAKSSDSPDLEAVAVFDSATIVGLEMSRRILLGRLPSLHSVRCLFHSSPVTTFVRAPVRSFHAQPLPLP